MNETAPVLPSGDPASPLISAQDLLPLLGRPEVKIFDVRGAWGKPAFSEEYAAGHIPGAIFLDWTRELLEDGVAIELASVAGAEGARESFRRLGIDPGDTVVLYDGYHHMLAGRIWWAMKHWGLENARVLDGGWEYWRSCRLPVSTDVPETPAPGSFEPRAPEVPARIGLEDFLAEHGQACVLDARGAAGYQGNAEDPRSGHIPGAVHVAYSQMLDRGTGLFLEAHAIEERLDRLAPEWREKPVITSCGSGYAGSVLFLALHLVGAAPRLFDGSFSVWRKDPSRPVERSLPDA
ncbi:MAG: hypothetical protein MI919_06840 [Holophagales bacterium]|nr:hypothetical protein [Holophagales bacterium]